MYKGTTSGAPLVHLRECLPSIIRYTYSGELAIKVLVYNRSNTGIENTRSIDALLLPNIYIYLPSSCKPIGSERGRFRGWLTYRIPKHCKNPLYDLMGVRINLE